MVEITAINHKLLFEITALISPSARKENDQRVVQGWGGRGRNGLPWARWWVEGTQTGLPTFRHGTSSRFIAGKVRERFSPAPAAVLIKGWRAGACSRAGWGSTGLCRCLLACVRLQGGAGLDANTDPLDEEGGPNFQVFIPKRKFVGRAWV